MNYWSNELCIVLAVKVYFLIYVEAKRDTRVSSKTSISSEQLLVGATPEDYLRDYLEGGVSFSLY